MSAFLDSFDVDQDKLELIDKAVSQPPPRYDKRICICGHPISRHDPVTNICKPSRLDCPCKRKHAVLDVPNTRFFLAKTLGSGEKHALSRGIFLARKGMGEDFDTRAEWLVPLKCENPPCGKETKLFPVMCDPDGYRLYDAGKDQGVTAFYCEDCREVYFDSDEAIAAKREAMRKRNTSA
jgi:hypothetical protein